MAALIIHRRTSLLCYFSDQDGGISMPIPPDVFSDMEILNEEGYLKVIAAMVGKMHAPTNAMLVLADDMCYFAQTTADKLDEVRKNLVDNTPFSHVETTIVRNTNQIFVIATNADVYETAVHAFIDKGVTIQTVLPWSALVVQKIIVNGEMDRVTVKRAHDSMQALKGNVFPLVTHEHQTVTPQEHVIETKRKTLSTGWKIFIGIAVLYAIGMIWFLLRS